MHRISIKKGKEKAIRQQHPWIFSGAIEKISGKPQNGEVVEVADFQDNFLAYGFYNAQSRVAVRVLSWDSNQKIDANWWRMRIQQAVNARRDLLESKETNTCRLIFSEADFLPGLIVDRYADFLSVQILSSGMEQFKSVWLDELHKLLKPKGIFDRSDANARSHEEIGRAHV